MVECRGLYWVRVCGMAVFGRDLSCRMRGFLVGSCTEGLSEGRLRYGEGSCGGERSFIYREWCSSLLGRGL